MSADQTEFIFRSGIVDNLYGNNKIYNKEYFLYTLMFKMNIVYTDDVIPIRHLTKPNLYLDPANSIT